MNEENAESEEKTYTGSIDAITATNVRLLVRGEHWYCAPTALRGGDFCKGDRVQITVDGEDFITSLKKVE